MMTGRFPVACGDAALEPACCASSASETDVSAVVAMKSRREIVMAPPGVRATECCTTETRRARSLSAPSGSLAGDLLGGVLVGAEAQQRADVAGALELLVAADGRELHAVAHAARHQCVGHVGDLARRLAADRAAPHHARIE